MGIYLHLVAKPPILHSKSKKIGSKQQKRLFGSMANVFLCSEQHVPYTLYSWACERPNQEMAFSPREHEAYQLIGLGINIARGIDFRCLERSAAAVAASDVGRELGVVSSLLLSLLLILLENEGGGGHGLLALEVEVTAGRGGRARPIQLYGGRRGRGRRRRRRRSRRGPAGDWVGFAGESDWQ